MPLRCSSTSQRHTSVRHRLASPGTATVAFGHSTLATVATLSNCTEVDHSLLASRHLASKSLASNLCLGLSEQGL